MASISDIKKKVILENNVFTQWMDDLEMFEETYLYARELAESMLGKGGEDGFVDFSSGKFGRSGLPGTVNTYPFGEKTDKVYPEFIGVCQGDMKLNDLFKAVKKQLGYYMDTNFEGRDRKAITVFTDKWDPKKFDKLESLFLKAILLYNVYFNFYLVTDYGISRIPFMDRNQIEVLKRNYSGDVIEEAMTLREFVEKEGLYDVEYEVEQYDSWIPVYDHMNYRYSFDFEKLQYRFEDSKGEIENGKINEIYALRFLRAAISLRNIGGLISKARPTNYVNRIIDFGRFSFEWSDNTGVEDAPEVADMVESLMAMISTLK